MVESVLTGVGERLLHQAEPEVERRSARPLHLREHARVVRRIDHHQDIPEVLGRRPHQARAADVDLFDQGVEGGLGILRRPGKRVEIDDDQVDRRDAVPGDGLEVVGPVPARQDAAVDVGMEGLDAAVHHLREAGDVGDTDDRQSGLGEGPGGPPGRNQLDPEGGQAAGKIDQAGFLRNAQNCSHKGRFT